MICQCHGGQGQSLDPQGYDVDTANKDPVFAFLYRIFYN